MYSLIYDTFFFFLTYFTLYDKLWVHPHLYQWSNFVPFYSFVAKSWLIGKYSDAGRDWGQEDKGPTEDEMAGWHHWLDGHESEWTPGVGDGQRGLLCCSSWGRKESDTTEWLKWTETSQIRADAWHSGFYIASQADLFIFESIVWNIPDICIIRLKE